MNKIFLEEANCYAYADSHPYSCGYDEVFNQRAYDCKFSIEKDMRVLDAGACVGMFTLKASKAVGEEGFVVAVEPHGEAYEWLLKNVQLNELSNVGCVNRALWDSFGYYPLNIGWLGATSLTHKYENGTRILAETITIELLEEKYGKFDFLKIDTEGAELQILKNYNPKKKVRIALEAHDQNDKLEELLKGKGFTIEVVKREGMPSMIYARN